MAKCTDRHDEFVVCWELGRRVLCTIEGRKISFKYKMAYEGAIAKLPDKAHWIASDEDFEVGVPKSLRPRGRPKKRRIKSFMENNNPKRRSVHKCGRCGDWGHHKSTCKSPLGETSGCSINSTRMREKLPVRREERISVERSD